MKSINPSGSRIDLDPADSVREILKLADDPALDVLQFRGAMPLATLEGLNREFFPRRPDVQLRAYAFYGGVCDLSFCSTLSNVERFSADCLRDAVGVEHIAEMPRLNSLGLGIWNLESFAFLDSVTSQLRSLIVSETKSKKPDLAVLMRFKELRKLFINGQQKNIDVLATLENLEVLSLSSVTLTSLDMLREMPKLWSFTLILGGTRDLSGLQDLSTLKYLELCWIRELVKIDVVSSLTGLQHLSLDRLKHIQTLPPLDRLHNLRRVSLDMMKGLTDISSLASAPALQEVIHIDARVSPEAYLPLLQRGSLKAMHAGFGSLPKNDRFAKLCEKNGVQCGCMQPFVFHTT